MERLSPGWFRSSGLNAPAILARLEAEGRLHPAKNPGYLPQRLHPVVGANPNPLSRALLEDRESDR